MAAAQLMLPANRAFDSNGFPEAGATVKLYESGTTTPANFYADDALTIVLGSTLTANAAGRIVTVAYQDVNTAFRLKVFDASGDELDDIDPFYFGRTYTTILDTTQANVATRNAMAGVAGVAGAVINLTEAGREGQFIFDDSDLSSEVTADALQGIYVPPLATTGSNGAWVRNFDGPIMAHWFGLNADGTTDDTTAFNAAFSLADTLGKSHVHIRAGSYAVATALDPPNGVTISGEGRDTLIIASGAAIRAFAPTSKNNIVIRDMALRGANVTAWRAAVYANLCTNCIFQNIVVDGITDSSGIILVDCDYCTIDNLYFDGGTINGYGSYLLGCVGCKTVNSTAINCFGGFVMSGQGTDAFSTRTIAQTHGNIIANCYVKNCASQAFNVNSSTYNVFVGCTADTYTGTVGHKAFQVKDETTHQGESVGNMFVGCTAKDYPAGFGVVRAARAVFDSCTGGSLTTNFIELVDASDCQFRNMSVNEFGSAPYNLANGSGVYISGASVRNHVQAKIDTSTATAKGIWFNSVSACTLNTFDVRTSSTLAAYCDINASSTGNTFLIGCKSNDNALIDASNASVWPVKLSTPVFTLTATSTNYMTTGYTVRGMVAAIARFVVTTTITGTPQVRVGDTGSSTSIAAAQAVSGSAGSVTNLTLASGLVTAGKILTGGCAATGTAGGGYVQIEGLQR